MIKEYKGMKAARFQGREHLPQGGYVVKILEAKLQDYSWGQVLILNIDVYEGEYKDFFAKDWRSNSDENRKWRGTFRITVPDEGSQYFESQRRSFNNLIGCLEESNSGYHYDQDEKKLKGLLIGALYREKEYEIDGKRGWTTECCSVTAVDSIREGSFKVPEKKPLKSAAKSEVFTEVSDDDDLPF